MSDADAVVSKAADVVPPDRARPLLAAFRKQLAAVPRAFTLEVDFEARPGFTILFGPSGAGKTTVLDCIAGLSLPDSGRISASDRVLFDSSDGINIAVARRHIGYVLQDLALFPHMTVEQNVAF